MLLGTWLQQRVPADAIAFAFALLLVAAAIQLAVLVVILAALIGVLAGIASGLLGIGGGILFVPALTILLGHGQVEAEATSLLAIVPVALVGSWRQRALRQPAGPRRRGDGRAVDRRRDRGRGARERAARARRCGSASRCCC